jgi:hypothetical protein
MEIARPIEKLNAPLRIAGNEEKGGGKAVG